MKGAAALFSACFVGAVAAAAPQIPGAAAFVRQIYAGYAQNQPPDRLDKLAGVTFSPALLKEIQADQLGHPGDVGKLDFDPFCDCQDSEGLKLIDIAIAPLKAGMERATVRFNLDGETRRVRLTLTPATDGWRVDDVSTASTPSLRRFLAGP